MFVVFSDASWSRLLCCCPRLPVAIPPCTWASETCSLSCCSPNKVTLFCCFSSSCFLFYYISHYISYYISLIISLILSLTILSLILSLTIYLLLYLSFYLLLYYLLFYLLTSNNELSPLFHHFFSWNRNLY